MKLRIRLLFVFGCLASTASVIFYYVRLHNDHIENHSFYKAPLLQTDPQHMPTFEVILEGKPVLAESAITYESACCGCSTSSLYISISDTAATSTPVFF